MSEFPILPLLGVFLLVALFLIVCGWCFRKALQRLYTIELDPGKDLAKIGLKFIGEPDAEGNIELAVYDRTVWPATEEDYEDIEKHLARLKRDDFLGGT